MCRMHSAETRTRADAERQRSFVEMIREFFRPSPRPQREAEVVVLTEGQLRAPRKSQEQRGRGGSKAA
jgi:hypothetical protein